MTKKNTVNYIDYEIWDSESENPIAWADWIDP